MSILKKFTGAILMLLAPLLLIVLCLSAYSNINPEGTKDINKPIPWVIIIIIALPIIAGLAVFGFYALKGAYDDIEEIKE